MEVDKETREQIEDLQNYEQNLHAIQMQKQAFQLELSETENALLEISKTNEEVYKLIGNIIVKKDKKSIEEDLKKKKDLINLRLKSIEKQEMELSKQSEDLREEVIKKLNIK